MKSLEKLLKIDLLSATESIGLATSGYDDLINETTLYDSINDIEMSVLRGGDKKRIAAMCGLLWTHFGEKYDLLGEYIYSVMSMIGFSPVLSMLRRDEDGKILASSALPMLMAEVNSLTKSISVLGKKYKLTEFQHHLWKRLEEDGNIAVSAPTSAGKSFLICLNAIHGISQRGGISIYIVPTLTLMNQVSNDLMVIARRHGVDVQIETHLGKDSSDGRPTVFVVTQERISEYTDLISSKNKGLNFLIIDEIQNIERAFDFESNDTRSKLLLDVIIDIHDACAPFKTIVSGPRISEIQSLGEKLFRKGCTPVSTLASPVANICYSVHPCSAKAETLLIKQYSEFGDSPLSLRCDNTIGATGFGKSEYSEHYLMYLQRVLQKNDGCLIFSPTAPQCRKTATNLAASLPESEIEMLYSLSEYVKDSVSPKYDLANCVEHGVAFHHGKMPHHIRNAIEYAVTQSWFKHVVCTTTLMQGVNIPARNVVIRNPNLFIKGRDGEKPKLSNYEIANLRGRAGRLLRDFIGRTFILDGTSFEEADVQSSLFEPAHKEIDGNYSRVFNEHREEVIESLRDGRGGEKASALSTYISNVVYTEAEAAAILERKGIHLSPTEIAEIKRAHRRLSVSKEICKKHRYWNPFDLDIINSSLKEFDLPSAPFSPGAKDKLADSLLIMLRLLPHKCHQYLGKRNSGEASIWVISRHSISWAMETSLRTILAEPYSMRSSDNTDSTITQLQNTISFDVPALLSPIYSMKAPNSVMLSSIEAGAYKPSSIALIKGNIPRETAIKVAKSAERKGVQIDSVGTAVRYLRRSRIPFWDAIQFRHVVTVDDIVAPQ